MESDGNPTPHAGDYGEDDGEEEVATEKKDDAPMEDAPEDEQKAPVTMPPPSVMPPPPPVVETVKYENDEEGQEVTYEPPPVPPPSYPRPPPKYKPHHNPNNQLPMPFAVDDDETTCRLEHLHRPLCRHPSSTRTKLFGSKATPTSTATTAQLADAAELTRFALMALEDKNANLAAERLQQALADLGMS
jgi:hypothetical protein